MRDEWDVERELSLPNFGDHSMRFRRCADMFHSKNGELVGVLLKITGIVGHKYVSASMNVRVC